MLSKYSFPHSCVAASAEKAPVISLSLLEGPWYQNCESHLLHGLRRIFDLSDYGYI